jgi:hypothetical protein
MIRPKPSHQTSASIEGYFAPEPETPPEAGHLVLGERRQLIGQAVPSRQHCEWRSGYCLRKT